MTQVLTIIILILILVTILAEIYLLTIIHIRNTKVFSSNIEQLEIRNKSLETQLNEANKALMQATRGIDDTAFVIDACGVKALPKNWKVQIKWDQ